MRIERLWVDVTAQIGATWSEHFTMLELRHGLNINNVHHIWLLHYLFLSIINQQLAFFADSWNQHRIQIRNGPNRSPADMFGFDMFVHGIRGDRLPLPNDLPPEEIEVFGVDWEGLRDEVLLESQHRNNTADEGSTSWIGRIGPPDHLNEVPLDPPDRIFGPQQLDVLASALSHICPAGGVATDADVAALWMNGLILARSLDSASF